MDKLVLIPPIISIFLIWRKGFGWAFVYWWIPLMMAIPAYLELDGPGIPPMNFYITGFLPFLFKRELRIAALADWHWFDLFVYGFLFIMTLSEYHTTGFASARQLLFLGVLSYLGPYLALKYVILHECRECQLAIVFVVMLAAIALFNLYEFRFGVNQFLRIRLHLWPNYYPLSNIVVIPRWGFFRASGPFVHPIVAGMAFGFILPMTFWLTAYRIIRPFWLGATSIGCCLLGVFMTFSRGPMLGALIAVFLYLAGQSRYRVPIFLTTTILLVFLSVPLGIKGMEYFSVDRASAKSSTQETALYRKELIENYVDVIKERPLLGYGFLNIPYVGGQKSIDNAYIYYALEWGVFAPLLILGLCLACGLTLLRLGLNKKIDIISRGIVWAILGGIVGCMFSMATVYLAKPVSSILFMWAGWTAAFSLRFRRGRVADWIAPNAHPSTEAPKSGSNSTPSPSGMVIL